MKTGLNVVTTVYWRYKNVSVILTSNSF